MDYLKLDITTDYLAKNPFSGSMIRGAFGMALKKTVCINPSYLCENCFALQNCLYYSFFESQKNLLHYRLDIGLGFDVVDFSLYLFGNSCAKLPYVLGALQMMQEIGFGSERTPFKITALMCEDKVLYDGKRFSVDVTPKTFQNDRFCCDITVRFATPLRLKRNNTFLKSPPTLLEILVSIMRRREEIYGVARQQIDVGEIITQEVQMSYLDLTRYSNRQKTKMQLGGTVGHMRLSGVGKEVYDLLKLGEVIGVGKSTVFGLGKIKIEDEK